MMCTCIRGLLGEQLLDIGLDIFRDTHGARLAHQEFAAKVPARIAGAGGVAHELPELGGGVADDTSKLHNDAVGREVLLGGEGDDFLVTSEFLPSELLGREGKDGKVVAELAELLEPRVFTRGEASSAGHVGGVHHLALEVGSAESRAVALLCREIVEGGCGHGGAGAEGSRVDTRGDECLGEASRGEDESGLLEVLHNSTSFEENDVRLTKRSSLRWRGWSVIPTVSCQV